VIVGLLCTWRRPSAAFVRGFSPEGPLAALVFGASVLLALAIGGPRYAFAWSGPGPFAWAYGIALVALGCGLWAPPAEMSTMPYTPHRPVILSPSRDMGARCSLTRAGRSVESRRPPWERPSSS
jgi:hypothetical protein